MSTVPCCFGCTRRGLHHPTNCPALTDGGECRGCLPRTSAVGTYCQHHYDRTLDALIDIPDLTTLVATSPGGKVQVRRFRTSDPTRQGTKVHQASPSPAWDATDDVITWAYAWCEIVTRELGHTPPAVHPNTGLPAPVVSTNIAYLRAQLDRIADQVFAHDFAYEAISHARGLKYMTGSDELIHRLKGSRCPECKHQTLIRHDGASKVECRNLDCRRVWTEQEYGFLARTIVAS